MRKPALVEKNSILAVLRHAVIHYQHALWDPSTPDALRYLVHHRRLSEPTLRAFAVGYALPSVTADLLQHALANQHLPHQLVQAGLARSPQPGQVLDLFRARVVTPIRDLTGSTLAVAGRVLPPSHPRVPKYINGPETAVFRKKDALFGIDFAARAPSAQADHGYVVIVEGYMDVMTMFEMTEGRVACVATMGAAMSQSQLSKAYDLLKDPVDGKLIINFDADEAGITAVERLCHSIIPQSECPHIVYIAIPPPPVKDPDEFLRLVGKADEYVMYLLESALPWYEWLGDRIVQEELERMISVRPQTLDWTSQIQDDDIEPSTLRTIGSSEDKFDFLHAEFLRKQRDDMLVSFGAPVDVPKARQNMPAEWKCSEEVVERLSEIIVSAQKCLPGLNTSALVQSWADSLSLGKPKVLLSLFAKIIQRCEELSRPWRELTVPVQVSWMPPPAWIVNDLPKKKAEEIRSSMGYDVSNDVIELEAFLSDPKRMKRSSDKMDFQAKYVIPRLREGQCEQSRRLKVAPRRSAEEITLRALIFCSEVDRLDGLQQMLDVMVRCQERGLPFWTSAEREALFDYLCNVEGSKSPEEMAADLDEKEWWNSEIEELFIPIEEESDMEWRAIRNLEIKHPVKVITTTAMSVETMAGKVRSRIALQESGEIMKQLLEESKGGKGLDDVNGELPRFDDLKELMAKQISLKKEIDRSRYMTPEEIAEREQDRKERIEKVERERKNAIVAKALETNSVVFEGHDDILGTSKNDEDESLQLGV